MPQGQNKPTQKTIAKKMGLAVTTVSRALKGDPKIAEATRVEVARVAEEIGYVPDRAAQRLRTGKTRVISLILNPHDEMLGFSNRMISGISQSVAGTDYHLTITPSFDDDDQLAPIKRLVRNGLADGILLTRTSNFDERVRYLMEQDFPFLTHGQTDFSQKHNFVDFDNDSFAYFSAKRLVKKGSNKLAIILPRAQLTFHQHLRYGFMRAVSEEGLEHVIPDNVALDSPPEMVKAWIKALCAERKRGTVFGFVCPGEACFLGLHAALRDCGMQHGRDYHAVVKTSSAIVEQIDPSLDRVFEDIQEAGRFMGQNMLAVLKGNTDYVSQYIQKPIFSFGID
ncbi:LacI family transcriptional regulator [uncultured Cohaesibacter sp.]|uniref:LacI family transcriptional regulator n=1 Tax=uncultured Cohaesibacter sp. TaxID=1002546 RepID=UPI00293133C4|nr:LacI family transcriptional regulator [uncultured Cohaesibacter sp.]